MLHGLHQLIKDPTRFGKARNSILDLIFTNQPSKYSMLSDKYSSFRSFTMSLENVLNSQNIVKIVTLKKYQIQNCLSLMLNVLILIGVKRCLCKILIMFCQINVLLLVKYISGKIQYLR